MDSEGRERTDSGFWDEWWQRYPLPPSINPTRRGLKNYPFRRFHEYFERIFYGHETKGMKLIEVGCLSRPFCRILRNLLDLKFQGLIALNWAARALAPSWIGRVFPGKSIALTSSLFPEISPGSSMWSSLTESLSISRKLQWLLKPWQGF